MASMSYPKFALVTPDRSWGQGMPNFATARQALVDATSEGMNLEIVQVIETVVLRSKDIPASELAPPPKRV